MDWGSCSNTFNPGAYRSNMIDNTHPLPAADLPEQLQQRLSIDRPSLVTQYQRALRDTLFTSRSELRPTMLGRIASEEADQIIAFLQQPLPAARPTHLERRSSLGRLVPVSAGIGAACGGTVGMASLLAFTASSPAGAVLGGVSSAVMGGLFGFLGASFVEVVRTSLREAVAAERGLNPPPDCVTSPPPPQI